jgi:hypothetical protein
LFIHLDIRGSTTILPNKKPRFTRKTKGTIAMLIAGVLLVSFFAFTPMQAWSPANWFNRSEKSTLLASSRAVDTTVWRGVAANAWAYFEPGIGVDSKTGLPYAGASDFKGFTDWDLGVYIQSVIDTQKIGLIIADGDWGSNERLEKVVHFLETRPLNESTNFPFWFYDATNGQDYHQLSDKATLPVDGADTGRLLLALNNLKVFQPGLTSRINYIVFNRTDYTSLLSGVTSSDTNIYAYYIYSGYAAFWPNQLGNVPSEILSNIASKPKVTTYGISLPNIPLTCEPLLCSIFELNSTDIRLADLMGQVYLAHEAYYNTTGQYVAFSEGNSMTSQFIYEWIVAPNGSTWKITDNAKTVYYNINPIIYDKVALGFLALYNTTYSYNLSVYLEKNMPKPTNGYLAGVDTTGKVVPGAGSNTNGLILDAALYALQKGR